LACQSFEDVPHFCVVMMMLQIEEVRGIERGNGWLDMY
jgi:hypothetical protein